MPNIEEKQNELVSEVLLQAMGIQLWVEMLNQDLKSLHLKARTSIGRSTDRPTIYNR